jgi:hypothetical protein
LLGFEPGQIMRCTVNGNGVLMYAAVERKPVAERLTYRSGWMLWQS